MKRLIKSFLELVVQDLRLIKNFTMHIFVIKGYVLGKP